LERNPKILTSSSTSKLIIHPRKKKPVIYQHNNYFVTYLQKIYIEEMEDEDVSEDNNTSSLPQEQPNNRVME